MTLRVVVLILAVWRVTCYAVYEKSGEWLRDAAKIWVVNERGEHLTRWGKVLSCFWCTSLYAAVLLAPIMFTDWWWLLVMPAASGAAILLNHIARVYLAVER